MEAGSVPSTSQQRQIRALAAVLCLLLLLGDTSCRSAPTSQSQQPAASPEPAQTPANQQSANDSAEQQPPKIPADQLDALVAPIALYPDALLGQVLVASTYPLE